MHIPFFDNRLYGHEFEPRDFGLLSLGVQLESLSFRYIYSPVTWDDVYMEVLKNIHSNHEVRNAFTRELGARSEDRLV
jgi:hypothetical protein